MKRIFTQPLPNSMLLVALLALIYFTFNVFYETISFAWGFTGILICIMVIAASFISIDPGE
jgi:hypothetical protein